MALVLRKALLTKNVTLLKCITGRTLTNAATKKSETARSTAVPWRRTKVKKPQLLGYSETEQLNNMTTVKRCRGLHRNLQTRYCISCPNLITGSKTRHHQPPRYFSPPRIKPASYEPVNPYSAYSSLPTNLVNTSMLKTVGSQLTFKRAYSKPCECPFPCGPCGCPHGCGCLPPPCNQPPRCVQYMTGYYYYPYGYWFCGPYHVSGICAPVGPSEPSKPGSDSSPKCSAPASDCKASAAPKTPQASHAGCTVLLKTNIVPVIDVNTSPRDNNSIPYPRSSISKLFPFNAAVAPEASESNAKHGKKATSPTSSTMSAKFCTYSKVTPSSVCSKNCQTYCKPHGPCYKCSHFSTLQSYRSSKPVTKKTTYPSSKSLSYYENIRKGCRSPVRHKTTSNYLYEFCPTLEKPRELLSREERDRPDIGPGLFDYSMIPRYKKPYPQQLGVDYES